MESWKCELKVCLSAVTYIFMTTVNRSEKVTAECHDAVETVATMIINYLSRRDTFMKRDW